MGITENCGSGQSVRDTASGAAETGATGQGERINNTEEKTADAVSLKPRQISLLRRLVCPGCDNPLDDVTKTCPTCSVDWSWECDALSHSMGMGKSKLVEGMTTTEFLADQEQQLIRAAEEQQPVYAAQKQQLAEVAQVPFTRQDLFRLHETICKNAISVMVAKNQDYSGTVNQDPFGNFRKSTSLGIHPIKGILLRCLDKFSRLESFIESGTLAVKDEPVDDIFRDVINYMVLAAGLVEESRRIAKYLPDFNGGILAENLPTATKP